MGTSDSKLLIQKCVVEMKEKNLVGAPAEFWSKFWTLPSSIDDFFASLTADDVREIKKKNPVNLQALLEKAVALIAATVALKEKATQAEFAQVLRPIRSIPCLVLNVSRMLARVMPLLLEDPSDPFVERYLWATTPDQAALITRVIYSLYDLLFLPNFTIGVPKKLPAPGEPLPLDFVWTAGVGTSSVLSGPASLDLNRGEVLRALLASLSSTLYRTPSSDSLTEQRILELATSKKVPHGPALFYSLINIACAYDPVGWGLPYNHMLFSDYKESVSPIALQVLLVLLNHSPASAAAPTAAPTPQLAAPAPSSNVFLQLIREINKPEEFKFLYSAITRLLSNPLYIQSTYLPNAAKQVKNPQEVLMLLWRLFLENRNFLAWVLRNDDINKILVPVLHFVHEGRKDPSQIGLVHLGTFILLYLSGEREFSVAINAPVTQRIYIDVPSTGSYADILLLVVHKLLVDGQPKLDSLYECLLTVLANVSPYLKSLQMVSAIKLMKLFEALSKPSFLFAAERNHRYLFFLLEVFNNVVQYQYAGNSRLVYALIRNREAFQNLANLSLKSKDQRLTEEAKPAVVPTPAAPAPAPAPAPATAVAPAAPAVATPAAAPAGTARPPAPAIAAPPAAAGGTVTATKPAAAAPATPPPASPAKVVPSPVPSGGATPVKASSTPAAAPSSPAPTVAPAVIAAAATPATQLSLKAPAFVATQEWLNAWKPQLPLNTILRLLNGILPQISSLVEGSATDEAQILSFLQKTTLVGIIPVPHPILIRQYSQNAATNVWFTTYMWGVIFLQNRVPPMFVNTTPKLFVLHQEKDA